jgi:hypothetical protein
MLAENRGAGELAGFSATQLNPAHSQVSPVGWFWLSRRRRPSPPFVAEFGAIALTFAPPNGGRSS